MWHLKRIVSCLCAFIFDLLDFEIDLKLEFVIHFVISLYSCTSSYMMNDHIKITWVAIICLVFGIGLPIGIWCLIIVRNDWNKIYIIKRRRIFIVTLLICLYILSYCCLLCRIFSKYTIISTILANI